METPEKSQTALRLQVAGGLAVLLVVAIFYLIENGFGPDQSMSPLAWLKSTWNPETDFEHGFLVPIISVGLVIWRWPQFRKAADLPKGRWTWVGLGVALLGAGLFVMAHRSGQARLAAGGLPMILWGCAWYLYGGAVAKLALFPCFLFWLAIPVPQFQQATTHLQILSTKLAQIGCGWFGVETEVRGTQIFSFSDKWEPLEIDEGCGGIRSLMALILISTVWAYVARMSLWKKALLCTAAVPLAIIGNMLRLTSIFVIAEYGDPVFARDTWHDWSGLIVFYPISLILLLTFHSLLEGGLTRFRRPRLTRREVGAPAS
jgi:exosortase